MKENQYQLTYMSLSGCWETITREATPENLSQLQSIAKRKRDRLPTIRRVTTEEIPLPRSVQVWLGFNTYDTQTERCTKPEGTMPYYCTTDEDEYKRIAPRVCMNWYTGTVELTAIPKEDK
jgi:hypothetical protein